MLWTKNKGLKEDLTAAAVDGLTGAVVGSIGAVIGNAALGPIDMDFTESEDKEYLYLNVSNRYSTLQAALWGGAVGGVVSGVCSFVVRRFDRT